jgi:hypothetical protein
MMAAWRFRRCDRCGHVARASDFLALAPYGGWGTGEAQRECPGCGVVAPTASFPVVRERHAPSYAGAGTASPWP